MNCLEWTGKRDKDGYGKRVVAGKEYRVHRLAYIQAHGRIPKHLHVLHRCDNPPCYRLEHLFLGTHQDNVRDMVQKRRHNWGIKNGGCKLKPQDIIRIRREFPKSGLSYAAFAKLNKISTTLAFNIVKRKRWKLL